MKIKKIILNICLGFINFFVKFKKVNENQVAFISLESQHLDSDLLLIYNAIKDDKTLKIKTVMTGYDQHNIIQDFMYMLNTFKQIIVINTSKVVFIRDNNYVVSNFKREGVCLIQVWHACGAIKKFGNVIKREYPIANYDYVLSNSDYWKEPYSEAFSLSEDHVITTGLPRVDELCIKETVESNRMKMLERYPMLKDKKIILYAPTFRGNIYKGFQSVSFDAKSIIEQLPDDYYLLYKFHPLLKDVHLYDHPRVMNMNHEDTHDLFTITDCLVSDFSSIIFDFSLLNKPMHFFVPDLNEYMSDLGCFVDYKKMMPGAICYNEQQLIDALLDIKVYDIEGFKNIFFKYQDGHNIDRVVDFMYKQLKKSL